MQWYSLVTWVVWNLVSVCVETVLVSVQDRCRFSPNVGSEIALDASDCSPR